MELKSGKKAFYLIFFVSFSAFTFELLLTRIFSVLMWYHFASLSIGVAMLGLGGGGIFSYVIKDKLKERTIYNVLIIYFLSFILIHSFFFYFQHSPEKITPFLAFFHQPYFQPFQRGVFFSFNFSTLIILTIAYIVITIPFFLAGFVISSLFKIRSREIKRLYFYDLLGASSGALFVAVVLNYVSPMALFSLIAVIGFALLAKEIKVLSIPFFIIGIVFLYFSLFQKSDEIPIARGKVANEIIWVKWNNFSRVILYNLKEDEWSSPFGQSKYYHGYVPKQWGLLVDDTGYTVASEFPDNRDKLEFFRWNIISLPYLINNNSALIIGPGGGKDILCAIAMGVKNENITAVELNPLIVSAVNDVLSKETGRLYDKVNTHVSEGRSFLEKRGGQTKFDVIQATSVYGRIPPAAGIFTFAEDNLYTKEAFRTYFSSLREGGLLSLSRFIYEQTVPKMIALSITGLKDCGIEDFSKSIFLAKERGLAMVLTKKGIFTKDEIDILIKYCDEKGFDVLYSPYYDYDNLYSNLIKSRYEDIKIPTDDSPFYYYNLSKRDFLKSFFSHNDKFEERGMEILKFFIIISLLFIFLILFFPLILRRDKNYVINRNNYLVGLYFFLIGVGYILIEIIFIKSFSLFLETPMYSMIFVTSAMLFFSALGSLFSIKVNERKSMIKLFVALILLLFLFGFMLDFINKILYLNLYVKIVITLIFVGIPSFFMGMPFPYLLNSLGKRDEGLIPWAIAVNSGASVLGSFLCLISVVNLGFKGSFFIGALLYIFVFIVFLLIKGSENENFV
ncbi:MAG: hypothetical protein N2999_00445 [Proteobacteria bacterium]|nr:hypothetical protein [Pseudomonadota bacterium]